MKPIKISIVTPSFNQGKFIEDAIKSVKNQNYENFEHIIVDNCSSDETSEILKRYPHLKIISEPDEGQSDALNKGFKLATGGIIGWLNADDFYYPNTFQVVNQQFSNTNADAIYSNVKFINSSGDVIRTLRSHYPVKWLGFFITFIQSTSFFFKKEIIDDGNLIDKDLHLCMDRDFFLRLLYKPYKFKFVNDCFAAFRWHDTNKSISGDHINIGAKEYFYIINKNTGFKLKSTPSNILFYRLIVLTIAKPVRRMLKIAGMFKSN
ncbi:glycosyltransferase family 2 protein [Porifericola rhodea]|uniref:glycosyltransferase family 2 protein n=1 Tax=Porifericola rhodea TaxID=930972 RepID=UPI0026651546|nr:glycosyltransferase family 2 protein [Porifericola rhodea]WKN32527.1 glycosyltransferase family 2 protein [Porifericola rhodea]